MLIGMDEYPFHQIAESFAGAATGDPSWNDGHYFGITDHDGRVSLTASIRLYPNNDVIDGFVCLRHRDKQYNVRVSRRLRPDIDTLRVGPLGMEIAEPMKSVRLFLEPNERGIELDLLCTTTVTPVRSPVETTRIDGRLVSERTTYEVTGSVAGWVRVADERIELRDDTASFFRNHSWGMHPGRGGPRTYAAPGQSKRRTPGVRQWVLFRTPGSGGHFFLDPSGRRASGRGVLMYPDRLVDVTEVESAPEFHDGGRRLSGGSFTLTAADGAVTTYKVTDLGWVYCQGGGYFGGWDDGLGQGVFRGDSYAEGEVWDVSHPTTVVDESGRSFEFDHDWAENFVRLTGPDGVGAAHYECVVIREAEQWS
ncbi:hypothetical protein GIY30_01315 [Gordonia sp. HNM0687]|uniref:Uncharacterized protein n=1 Tax=Gordonia mangrovi TaxID=2665643 RepID=A0A6L7GJF2_9ACTN|nr:hypothetical protein [Gordonia mangrovi]MXP20006.1 hypothetical protein [Gordonia mangrovi]UVF79378.1 hypothetical protein NWF22_05935 [Gordonia mangrovi]